jgi:D-sedoheptulose 7-phosphate isomerase
MKDIITARIKESIQAKKLLLDKEVISKVEQLAIELCSVISNGGKVLLCGNGGSAADASHIAGELIGRFQKERDAWSAIALNADFVTMTAIANDYGYNEVFARQVSGHMKSSDILIGFSTSGNSENVLSAIRTARGIGGKTVVFTGGNGGKLINEADYAILAPATVTARIQECHILIGHILCELVELILTKGADNE